MGITEKEMSEMPITEILEKNAGEYGDEVALVELNPALKDMRRMTWK